MDIKPWKLTTALIIVVLLASTHLLRPLFWTHVYAGVTVDGVNIGGKDRQEVKQIITLWGQEYRSRHISVYHGDTIFPLDPIAIDFEIDAEATAEDAWNFGRRGNWWERLKNIQLAAREGYSIPLRIHYSEEKLAVLVDHWRERIDRPPRNAAFSLLAGGVVSSEAGRKLEVETLKPLVIQSLQKKDIASFPLPVTQINPEVTVEDINQTGLKEIWADYETHFDATDANRSANIRLAARKINGYIVYPGQNFSFNEVVGPREKEQGFKDAMEIADGELVPGIGGGICQVSSTLYNAVLLSNLGIVERSNHSKPLGYIGLGRDATVAYGVLDFVFVNNAETPIMIIAETDQDRLVVGIVGAKTLPEKVEVVTSDRVVIPPTIVKKATADLYLGESQIENQGKPGYEIRLTRIVKLDGKVVKQEVLSRDRYSAENTIIKIGTKVPPVSQKEMPPSGLGKKDSM